jgi:hypothetical protein
VDAPARHYPDRSTKPVSAHGSETRSVMFGPTLHAVVETPSSMPPLVGDHLPESRATFVRLSGKITHDQVSLVVASLATYSHNSSVESLDQLYTEFPIVTPGGLAAVHDELVIYPSCCCGLKSWRVACPSRRGQVAMAWP